MRFSPASAQHGVFANRSNDRPRLPPPPSYTPKPEPVPEPEPLPEGSSPSDTLPPPTRPRRSSLAQLLKRALHVDALTCPRCCTPMLVPAFLTDPAVIKNILDHLHLPTADPPRAPARVPLEQMTIEGEFREEGQDEPFLVSSPPLQRAPP